MLRIAHLGKYYPPSPGGIEEHTRTLARGRAALGAEVQVLVVNHATESGRDATFEPLTRTPDREECDGQVRVGRLENVVKLDFAPGLARALRRLRHSRINISDAMPRNFLRPVGETL